MRFSVILSLALASCAAAKPSRASSTSKADSALSDADILNNLLALEQGSASFYQRADQYFVAEDWTDLGVLKTIMNRQAQWASEDSTHVSQLKSAVSKAGGSAVSGCSYSFKYVHAPQFLAIARAYDGIMISAYIDAAGSLNSADSRVLAASILANKARRQSLITEIFGSSGFPSATDTALSPSEAYSAASAYVSGCSTSVQSNPTLSVLTKTPAAGKAISVKSSKLGSFLHVIQGTNDKAVALSSSGGATLPSGLTGRIYLATSNSQSDITQDSIVSGPVAVDLADPKANRLFAFGKQQVSWASES